MPNYFEDGSGDQWPLFDDPKPLQKQSKSPIKKNNRRGTYNFRKDNFQNLENDTSDVFSNFKFRNRSSAPKQRYAPRNQPPQTEVPWLLPSDHAKNDKAD